MGNVLNKGLTIRAGQCNVKRYLPRLFEHIRQGHMKPSDVITHRMPLHSVADAYNMMASKKDHMIKPFLVMDNAA